MLVHPHAVAMIGGEYHDGVVEEIPLFQCTDNAADLIVYTGHAGIILQYALPVEITVFRSFRCDDGGVAQ